MYLFSQAERFSSYKANCLLSTALEHSLAPNTNHRAVVESIFTAKEGLCLMHNKLTTDDSATIVFVQSLFESFEFWKC